MTQTDSSPNAKLVRLGGRLSLHLPPAIMWYIWRSACELPGPTICAGERGAGAQTMGRFTLSDPRSYLCAPLLASFL